MNEIKLGDIANVTAGQSAPQGNCFSDKGTPFIRAGSLEPLLSGKRESELELVSEEIAKAKRLKLQPEGTIVFAKSGMSCMKGYVYVLKRPCYVVSHLACVFPKSGSSDYLSYYFKWHRPNRLVKDEAYPSISLADISNITMELHSETEQEDIVERLDKVSELIDLRKRQLDELDTIVKSRFVEMFGKESDDTQAELRDNCRIITDGTHQPPKFTHEGIPFLFVSNIVDGNINYNTEKFISREEYETLIRRTPIEIGDILLTIVGSYGNPAIVKSDKEFCFQRHIAYLKPKRERFVSEYLHAALQIGYVKEQIERRVKGIAQKTLNLSELKVIRVNVPPLDLQNRFADFVKQVDKSKFNGRRYTENADFIYRTVQNLGGTPYDKF